MNLRQLEGKMRRDMGWRWYFIKAKLLFDVRWQIDRWKYRRSFLGDTPITK